MITSPYILQVLQFELHDSFFQLKAIIDRQIYREIDKYIHRQIDNSILFVPVEVQPLITASSIVHYHLLTVELFVQLHSEDRQIDRQVEGYWQMVMCLDSQLIFQLQVLSVDSLLFPFSIYTISQQNESHYYITS